MSRRKTAPAPALPVFEVGQRVRLTRDILRYAETIDLQYIEYEPPRVWFAAGEVGYILRRGNLENYWFIWWGDEPPPVGMVEGFPVHAGRLEALP